MLQQICTHFISPSFILVLLQFSWRRGLKDLYASGVLVSLWRVQALVPRQFYQRFERITGASGRGGTGNYQAKFKGRANWL
jgi:hypothetical protein